MFFITWHQRLFVTFLLIPALSYQHFFPAVPQPAQQQPHVAVLPPGAEEGIRRMENRVAEVHQFANNCVRRANESLALAHNANGTSIRAHEQSTEALERARQALHSLDGVRNGLEATRHVAEDVQNRMNGFHQTVEESIAQIGERVRADAIRHQNNLDFEQRLAIARAQVQEQQRLGVFENQERIRAQASLDKVTVQWDRIKEMVSDPKFIAKIVCALIVVAAGIYALKHTIPLAMGYFSKPTVIAETSRDWWFGNHYKDDMLGLNELIFTSDTQQKLTDLILRVQSALRYQESFPLVLLHGPPGTGKTAFVRALARESGLDYALTSGTEFAKLTDLNNANLELRNLIDWAGNTKNGLIVFIDEAESLFASRILPTTNKLSHDLINTFLTHIQNSSHKNILFMFATNHPFKLDDAILNRVGVTIEIDLPADKERALILETYLKRYSQERPDANVLIDPSLIKNLENYTRQLSQFSPRLLRALAEEMISIARRHDPKFLNDVIAIKVINNAQQTLEKIAQWECERTRWAHNHVAIADPGASVS